MPTSHHETQGLLSPWIRDLRLRRIAARIPPGSRVLDVACGDGFLARFLPRNCTYLGTDILEPTDRSVFSDFLKTDLEAPDSGRQLLEWLGHLPVDVVVCAAFLEHIEQPTAFIESLRSFLAPHGMVVGTTPHPRGRRIHDGLARIYLCSRAGAADHETFLSREDLQRSATEAGAELASYETFLWGLNQFFVFTFS